MKQTIARFLSLSFIILLGILLGLIIISFYGSRNETVKREIEKMVQSTFRDEYGVEWEGELTSIDLLMLKLDFSHATVAPLDGNDWSLYADDFSVSASWLELILRRRFSCHGAFKQMIMQQKEPGKSSGLLFFLKKIFASDLPSHLSFDVLTIEDGQVLLEDPQDRMLAAWKYNCQISYESDGVHIQTYFLDGSCEYQGSQIFDNLFGNMNVIYPLTGKMSEMFSRVDCRLNLPGLKDKKECFFVGDVYDGHGSFVLSNQDQSFIIEPLKITFQDDKFPCVCSINMASSAIQTLLSGEEKFPDLQGLLSLTLKGDLKDSLASWHSKLQLNKLAYKDSQVIDKASISFIPSGDKYISRLLFGRQTMLQGDWTFHDGWNFSLKNSSSLQPWWNSYWKVDAADCLLLGKVKGTTDAACKYVIKLQNDKLAKTSLLQGRVTVVGEDLKIEGACDSKRYEAKLKFDPFVNIVSLTCHENGKLLFDLAQNDMDLSRLKGFVDFDFMQFLVPEKIKSSFSQDGKIDMRGRVKDGVYAAKVETKDAHIRIPGLYNVMHDFHATTFFDLVNKTVTIQDLHAKLYEGSLHCHKATACIDDYLNLSFVHIPMILDNVMISWDKGIFGILSGRVLLQQRSKDSMTLSGNMIFEKAQLKGNIFSSEFQDKLFGKLESPYSSDTNCDLDLYVETKKPVVIKTSFMEAQAHIDLHAQGTAKRPSISGAINLVSGSLDFPYKKLDITYGRISLLGEHSQDPMIEIVAKGKIKRYYVSLRATGTVFDQQIKFESSPSLTEEQIVSLLMVGSADSSLSLVMPAFFMQKLKEIIFGPALSKSKLEIVFDHLLRPFKYVRFFPQFTSQTGGGGMRAVVEIDVTDRLQGRIDSNLSQLEDTRFEVDYAVTDDITIRGVRDKPSMYGGEVEMRWKFS